LQFDQCDRILPKEHETKAASTIPAHYVRVGLDVFIQHNHDDSAWNGMRSGKSE
jgi:hypothetical protein